MATKLSRKELLKLYPPSKPSLLWAILQLIFGVVLFALVLGLAFGIITAVVMLVAQAVQFL